MQNIDAEISLYFHGRCPLGRGRHNVEILCVCLCSTLLSKANINGWDNQGGCHNGQEGEDCYQEGEDDQKDGSHH